MSLQPVNIDTLAAVEATLNYLTPMAERPVNYAASPPPGVPRTNTAREPHRLPIHDLRPVASASSLDDDGFAAVRRGSAVRDFRDEDEIRRVYYPEAEALVKDVTGADRVFIFDHVLRRHIPGTEDYRDGVRQPARRVHVDHTARSAPQQCATCCRRTPRRCCAGACRSSMSGVPCAGRCRTRRSRSATRRASRRPTWCHRTSSIRTAPARPIR
jgi:hypothetical protein